MRWKIVLAIGIAIAVASGWVAAWYSHGKYVAADASRQTLALTNAGLQQAVLRKDAAVGENIAELQDVIAASKKAGAPPLAAIDIIGSAVPVRVPTGGIGGTDEPVELQVSGQFLGLASSNRLGEVFVKGRLFSTITQDDWTTTVELPIDDANSTIEVSRTLQDALAYYNNKPRRFALGPRRMEHWRTGLTVGAGVYLNSNDVGAAVFIGYGVQF